MKITELTKAYGEKTVLCIDELTLEAGVIYAALGANGSGKSTLVKTLAGIEPPDKGGCIDPSGAELCYMPQKSYGFKMSLWKNLMLGTKKTPETVERAERLLHELELSESRNTRGDRLSGGETQKLALARTLMRRCGLLLLDEPTASMDMRSTLAAERLIREYRDETGCTVLLVTHSIKQAERLGEELIIMEGGRIAERGRVKELIVSPAETSTKEFLSFYGS